MNANQINFSDWKICLVKIVTLSLIMFISQFAGTQIVREEWQQRSAHKEVNFAQKMC